MNSNIGGEIGSEWEDHQTVGHQFLHSIRLSVLTGVVCRKGSSDYWGSRAPDNSLHKRSENVCKVEDGPS